MHIWVQPSLFGPDMFSHVFPRPLGGGIVIGGLRLDNIWDDSFDVSLSDCLKRWACQLCPELGKPDDLQVVQNNVGLRRRCFRILLLTFNKSVILIWIYYVASRKGGARVEIEEREAMLVVHNYGAGGAGYQSSW